MNGDRTFLINAEVMLESMTESVLITTTDLDEPGPYIVYVNAAFEKMTGYNRREILKKSPRILQGAKTDHTIFEDLKAKVEQGEIWTGRTINYRKDGSEFHMEWSIIPIYDQSGHLFQYLAVQREVTKIVQTEKRLKAAKEREKRRIKEVEKSNQKLKQTLSLFSKYVPEQIFQKALKEKDVSSASVRLEASLLFCDIRGFTRLIKNLAPNEVVHLLNVYYSVMADAIHDHGGVINQFVGDEIFVAFGAPEPIEQPNLAAAYCAIDMIKSLDLINDQLKNILDQKLIVGIGLNYGPVIAGNLGSEDKISYAITGSAVVTAKRIESLTRDLENVILVSESVHTKTSSQIPSKLWGNVKIKGTDGKINVFQILPDKM